MKYLKYYYIFFETILLLKEIQWLNWEHAFYLLWYKWGTENPTHIIVWDTNTWKHTYATKEWLRKWGKMQDRSIVVYK